MTSEIMGTLLTFLPLLLIIALANLADRARQRALPEKEVLAWSPEDAPIGQEKGASAAEEALGVTFTNPASGEDLSLQPYGPPVSANAQAAKAPDGTVFAVLAYVALGMIYGLAALIGLGLLLTSTLAGTQPDIAVLMGTMNIGLLGWGSLIVSVLGLVVLLRPVRRALASFLPIDPLRTVHAVALSMGALVLLQTVFIMGVGIQTMADMMTQSAETGVETGAVSIPGSWFSTLMMVLFGAVGIGWLIRRDGRQTLQRLGIVMPSAMQLLISVGVGALLVGVIMVLEMASAALGWGVDEDVARLTEQMLGGLMTTIPGILTIGLAAGIGEEALMRGAAQPRLGLLLTSVIFALLHANYGITLSTLAVLIVGLGLGIVRQRMNTTSAMAVHATYNIILGLIAYFAVTGM